MWVVCAIFKDNAFITESVIEAFFYFCLVNKICSCQTINHRCIMKENEQTQLAIILLLNVLKCKEKESIWISLNL